MCITATATASSTPHGAMRATKNSSCDSSIRFGNARSARRLGPRTAAGRPLILKLSWLGDADSLPVARCCKRAVLQRSACPHGVSACAVVALRADDEQTRSIAKLVDKPARALFKRGEPWKQRSRHAVDRLKC